MKRQSIGWMLIILVIGLACVYPATAQDNPSVSDVSVSPASGPSGTVVYLYNKNANALYPCYADGYFIGDLKPGSYLEYTAYGEDQQTITFACYIDDVDVPPIKVGDFTVYEPSPVQAPLDVIVMPAADPPSGDAVTENNPPEIAAPLPERQPVQQVVTLPPPTRTPRPARQPAITTPENTFKNFEDQAADIINKLPNVICLGALQLEDVCVEKASYPTYGLLCIGLVVIVIIPRLFPRRRPAAPPYRPPTRRDENPPPQREPNPQPASNPCEQQAFQKYARRNTQMGGTCQPGALQCKLESVDGKIAPYKVTALEVVAYEHSNGHENNRKYLRGGCIDDLNDILNSGEGNREVLGRRLDSVAKNVLTAVGDWLDTPSWDYQVTIEAYLEGSGFDAKFALYRCTGSEWQVLSTWKAPVTDKRQEPVQKFASLCPEMLQTQPCRDELVRGMIEFIRQV